jgi:hypothetical protein
MGSNGIEKLLGRNSPEIFAHRLSPGAQERFVSTEFPRSGLVQSAYCSSPQYAEFEREIISERTRDKQVAARKRGKWTGGHLTLGYDLDAGGGRLVLNHEEAERVRQLFEWYLKGQSVFGIVAKCEDLAWRNKQWTTREGNRAPA